MHTFIVFKGTNMFWIQFLDNMIIMKQHNYSTEMHWEFVTTFLKIIRHKNSSMQQNENCSVMKNCFFMEEKSEWNRQSKSPHVFLMQPVQGYAYLQVFIFAFGWLRWWPGVTGVHQQLHICLLKRTVGLDGVKITHHPGCLKGLTWYHTHATQSLLTYLSFSSDTSYSIWW